MSKKQHFNIAITGPDGSGKTSVVNLLSTKLYTDIIYCGKKNHHYKLVEKLNTMILSIPTIFFPIKIYLRYVYYILEFFDLKKRINTTKTNKLLERYYTDRLIRYDELIFLYIQRCVNFSKKYSLFKD